MKVIQVVTCIVPMAFAGIVPIISEELVSSAAVTVTNVGIMSSLPSSLTDMTSFEAVNNISTVFSVLSSTAEMSSIEAVSSIFPLPTSLTDVTSFESVNNITTIFPFLSSTTDMTSIEAVNNTSTVFSVPSSATEVSSTDTVTNSTIFSVPSSATEVSSIEAVTNSTIFPLPTSLTDVTTFEPVTNSTIFPPSSTTEASPTETVDVGPEGNKSVQNGCRGSSFCKGCSHLSTVQYFANQINNDYLYTSGQQIACGSCKMLDKEGLCLFLEGLPAGTWIRMSEIKNALQDMMNIGCKNCGSVQMYSGILVANYVQHGCGHGVCARW